MNNLMFAIPVGTSNGTNQFNLSESDGSPGSDPYGHIHGRTFTASKPGLYTLGCRILDTSSNGTGGGPIHTPSAIYYFYFQAGTTIASLSHDGFNAIITFAGTLGKGYYVQSTTNFVNTNLWQDIAGPFTGNLLQSVTDTNINAAARYYRLRVTTP